MPSKEAVNLKPTDSSSYPDILGLWSKEDVRMSRPTIDMADLDPQNPKDSPVIDFCYLRMEVALRIATRAVVSSSFFYLKVLCAQKIGLDAKRIAFDPNYTH